MRLQTIFAIVAACMATLVANATIAVDDITDSNKQQAIAEYLQAKDIILLSKGIAKQKFTAVEVLSSTNCTPYIAYRIYETTTNWNAKVAFVQNYSFKNMTSMNRQCIVQLMQRFGDNFRRDEQISLVKTCIMPKDKDLGTMCLLMRDKMMLAKATPAALQAAAEAFNAIVPEELVAKDISCLEWVVAMNYAFNTKNYDFFNRAATGKFWSTQNFYTQIISSNRPEVKQKSTEMCTSYLVWCVKSNSPKVILPAVKAAKVNDTRFNNKEASASVWPLVAAKGRSETQLKLALYLNDADKTIYALTNADTNLTADSIASAISLLNALDPDYKPLDVLKALKAINQRYTLKLYDDRDTWEPILSKVRAMIDVRQ